MKLTVKIRRYFNSNMGRKVGGHGHIGPLKQKSQGAQAPLAPPMVRELVKLGLSVSCPVTTEVRYLRPYSVVVRCSVAR